MPSHDRRRFLATLAALGAFPLTGALGRGRTERSGLDEGSAAAGSSEGSAPSPPRISSTPTREAQVPSCSTAAARKVSAAQISTPCPSARK